MVAQLFIDKTYSLDIDEILIFSGLAAALVLDGGYF
jgi:hypothetical protein